MPTTSEVLTCAGPGCSEPVIGKRADARFHSAACRERARYHRVRDAHPHPYRDTPQYKQMRDMLAEYTGHHWVGPEATQPDVDHAGRHGSWDRYLERTGQAYATAYR